VVCFIENDNLNLREVDVTLLDEIGLQVGQNWDWAGTSETMFVEIF
jgi:hypothetical protein